MGAEAMNKDHDRAAPGRLINIILGASLLVVACNGTPEAPTGSPRAAGGAAASAAAPTTRSTDSDPAPSESAEVLDPLPSETAVGGQDYRGQGSSRTLTYSVAKCDGPTGGSWNVDIRESSGGGAFTFYEIPEGADQAPAQIDYEILLGDPANLEGTGMFVTGDPPHFVIENGEGRTDIELEVGSFCR